MSNPLSEKDLAHLSYCQSVVSELHKHLVSVKRFPHEGQSQVLRALFAEGKKILMGQCGRSLGKTELILYMAWRYALTHPGTETYIITPEIKQAKKIYWFPRRLQNYGPRMFVAEEFESKLQLLFKNGSYILLDGCENYEGHRGAKPDFVVYDEFQHHSKFFDEEVMQPNLSRGDVALVAMGTPPKRDCYYIEFRKNVIEKIEANHPDYFYVEMPSHYNPILDKNWLAEKKDDLFRKGKQNVWYREYEGKLMFDTESAIFPMFDKQKMCHSPEFIWEKIKRDVPKLDWYAVFDPGTASCFAVLFIAVNPYTSEVFLLDEIYETERERTTSLSIWARANAIKSRFNPSLEKWFNIYDEAAAWFENEVRRELSGGNFALIPTKKHKKTYLDGEDGRAGESVIMNMMLANKLFVSTLCEKFVWEMEQYVKDDLGRYPRHNDHCIDDLHYFVNNSGYTVKGEQDPEIEEQEQIRSMRKETFDEVIARERQKRDYAFGVEPDMYDSDGVEDIWR
jgi:hypothetical protein